MAFDGIYRPLPERCEIEASELKDAGWNDAAQVLWEAESRIRDLEAENARLREAMKLITLQHMGAGGNMRPEEVQAAMERIAREALR